jgi:putative membrane-bound dehydrogenase-like protein
MLAAGSWLAAGDTPKTTDQKEPRFKVPPGFVVERVAGPPLVEHPMMGCFDDRGRLFLAEAAGLNLNFEELLKKRPNFIRLLEPADARGHFHNGAIYADKMTFPMGVLWHDGALYTAAAPSIWRLQDSKHAGMADKRQALVSKFSSTGNGADIHGPFLGPDGYLYWTKGRHPHEIRRPDGSVLKGLAAHIFRCRPDGTDLEAVCGGGMDDPVEIAFTPEGEPLATVDILIPSPRHDAIIYGIEGGVYPHAANVMGEFKHTGDLLTAVSDLGWVAPAGLMRYRGHALGKEYEGNLFSAQFNTHKVQRHILERDGATFRAGNEDFLVSIDPDFHPTDVLEDADGSLLVIDTGGWFVIGCPTSRIAKPEVKGGIYRVRRKDARPVADPRGQAVKWTRLSPPDLVALLDDPRFAVRDRAVGQLAALPGSAANLGKVVSTGTAVRARRNAVWAAMRLETPEARAVVRRALDDKDPGVQITAAHGAGLHRDAEAVKPLLKLTGSEVPAVRREAATALGRIRRIEAVPALLEALRHGGDRFLEHALIYALIQIADRPATLKGLRDPSPLVRRGALIALDQMDGGDLTRDLVTPLLNTSDPALQKTALAIITTRPGWAKETVGLLRQWLNRNKLDESRQESTRGTLLAFCKDREIQNLVAQVLEQDQTPVAIRLLLLETMARAPLDQLPATWVKALGHNLRHGDERVVRQAVATVRAAGVADFDAALMRLARDQAKPADLRVAVLAAAAPRLPRIDDALLDFLVAQLDKDQPPLLRLGAAEALSRTQLEDTQLTILAGKVAGAGALEMPHLLAVYEHSKSPEVGKALVAALDKAPGLHSLSPDALRRTLQGYPAGVRQAAGPLLKRLAVDTDKQRARLAELEPVLSGGDAGRGRDVFLGKKATCTACHTIGSEGGRVGPDLSKIGSIRTGRDLLEAIVFPSASIVRGYEPYVIVTRDGQLHTGIIARQTADSIYLVTADRAEVRIPRSAVDTLERSQVSIMPQGLDAQLSRQELADLIAFLRSRH